MLFEVLGKSPAWQDAGGACSSYLVTDGDYRLLIDCGNGAFAKLRERIDYTLIDAVLVSHLHADHFLDLVPFAYGLTLPPGIDVRASLHIPPGSGERLERVPATWGSSGLLEDAFEVAEYEHAGGLRLGPLEIKLHPVPHFAETHAVELRSPGGGRLLYGADCRAGEEIVAAARGVDVLVAEATLPEREDPSVPVPERGHMSAAEAGEVAAEAGVGELILTHFSDLVDPRTMLLEAASAFEGPIRLAAEGMTIALE